MSWNATQPRAWIRWSRRATLRMGYAAVIAVLVLSTLEAYRIQTSVSRQHVEIYRRYVEQDQILQTLRRNLWLAGNYIRDFFVQSTPEQAGILRSQLDQLKAQDEDALQRLARVSPQSAVEPRLREALNGFWALVAPVPEKMLHASARQRLDFIQGQVVARREEVSAALGDLSGAEQRLQENEEAFADSRRSAAARLLAMLGVGVLLACLVTGLSLRHAENLERQAERNFAEVEQTKRELQQLSARLLEIEEEDRRRLARELHDEIGQALALLQIEVARAQSGPPSEIGERLRRARALAEQTTQTVRNISLLLRPALLDDLGLVPALQFQLEDFLRRSGIACDFEHDQVSDALPDGVKTCVYRVLQEALHNCEKHSGASHVRVAVRQLADRLLAEVEDDGRGFVLNSKGMPARSSGLGLLGIRERVANAGGSLLLDAAPGRGTRIRLHIPLPPEASAQPPAAERVSV